MDAAARTSISHPLQIAEILTPPSFAVGSMAGTIGVTFCPGKCGPSVWGSEWARDLAMDLDVIRDWGATDVVTLIEDHEFGLLQVRQLGEQIRGRGMKWHHLPIQDLSAPDARFEKRWDKVRTDLGFRLVRGGKVLVHCRGGLGRAGTVAAKMLIEQGYTPTEAIRMVRAVRPGAIETKEQVQYLHALRPDRVKRIPQYTVLWNAAQAVRGADRSVE
jgi:ADP-ribosyl-[dinitrogen reductase] hydrolase